MADVPSNVLWALNKREPASGSPPLPFLSLSESDFESSPDLSSEPPESSFELSLESEDEGSSSLEVFEPFEPFVSSEDEVPPPLFGTHG